jgi:hypothetical protein
MDRFEKRVVELSEEAADFLAGEFAEEAFGEIQSRVEFKPAFDVGRFQEARDWMDFRGRTIDRLTKERKIEVSVPVLQFAGGRLGVYEAFELEGWFDEPEYVEGRRRSRLAYDELRQAAAEIVRAELAEENLEAVA